MSRALPLVLISLVTFCLAACSTAPHAPPEERPARPVEVVLIPVGDFSYDVAVELARELTADVDVEVRATLPMGAADLAPRPDGQYAAEDVVARAAEVATRQPNRHAPSMTIALTTLDLNTADSRLRFVFTYHDAPTHTSAVSIARLGYTTSQVGATPKVVRDRLYKMTKRAIGLQYLGLSQSSSLTDVMYAPIMSLEDVDAMSRDFAHRPVPTGRFDLKPPPLGYSWRTVPAIAAAILVPAGWHFREERQGKTYALFVTQEEIVGDKGLFETGVTLNVFLDSPAAPLRLAELIRNLALGHSVPMQTGQKEKMVIFRCEFDSPRDGGREPIHVFYLGLVNRETRTSYLGIFEAPVSQWPTASAKGLIILDRARFASNL